MENGMEESTEEGLNERNNNEPYIVEPDRPSADVMDEQRREQVAYEYLCRLDEARIWMSECLKEELLGTVDLEESLRNGVVLARLANFFAPEIVSERKIFDINQERYRAQGLHFRHTDNLMHWQRAMKAVGLPEVFLPDTTDIYDKKNMPKAVFCLHALSLFLYRRGVAPPMRDTTGKVAFTKEEIAMVAEALAEQGVHLPPFSKIGGMLAEELSADEAQLHAAVVAINEAVESGDAAVTVEQLQNPLAGVAFVVTGQAEEYQQSLSDAKQAKQQRLIDGALTSTEMYDSLLSQDEIQSQVDGVNESIALDRLNEALSEDSADGLMRCLLEPSLRLPRVWPAAADLYLSELRAKGTPLNRKDLFRLIQVTNAVVEANQAVRSGQVGSVIAAFENPVASLDAVHADNGQRYLTRCTCRLDDKQNEAAECSGWLTRDELQQCIAQANQPLTEEEHYAALMDKLHVAARDADSAAIVALLGDEAFGFSNVTPDNARIYARNLNECVTDPETAGAQLSFDEIQDVIARSNADVDAALDRCAAVVALNDALASGRPRADVGRLLGENAHALRVRPHSAYASGYAADLANVQRVKREANPDGVWFRQPIADDVSVYWNVNSGQVTFDQTVEPVLCWYLNDTEIKDVVDLTNDRLDNHYGANVEKVTQAQAQVRRVLAQRAVKQQRAANSKQDESAKKIQRFFRTQQTKRDYQTLAFSDSPSLRVVRTYATLLERTEIDYEEELEMERLKSRVAQQIRSNRKMEEDLSVLDMKIGLLVKNRLGVEDVLKHSQKMTEQEKRQSLAAVPSAAAKQGSLRRSRRDRLGAYEHLLYHLQTEAAVTCRLLFAMNASKVNRFVDSVLFPLFNYAAQRREECLIVRLLATALGDEIDAKIRETGDFARVQLIVPRIAAQLARQLDGDAMLNALLGDLVRDLTSQNSELHVNTYPLEIYQYVVGTPPDGMTEQEASENAEVAAVLHKSIEYLTVWAQRFVDAIAACPEKIPYVLRHLSNVLLKKVRQKFADASETQLYRIVGRLVYSEFLYPAIVSPEAVMARQLTEPAISPTNQKKLACVAKLLQFGTANKGFGSDHAYLAPLNPCLRQFNDKFRDYFVAVCDVDEPTAALGVELDDSALTCKPTVFLSVADLLFLHQLLLDNRAAVVGAADAHLGAALDALGKVPTNAEIAAAVGEDAAAVGQAQLTLALACPSPPVDAADSAAEQRTVFLRTKKLLVDLLLCRSGDSLPRLLSTDASEAENVAYNELKTRRETKSEDETYNLDRMRDTIAENLRLLESNGAVSSADGYQSRTWLRVEDIRRARSGRDQRKAELGRLRDSFGVLDTKRRFLDDQATYYQKYIEDCLENLAPKHRRRSVVPDEAASDRRSRNSVTAIGKSVKYSGEKLARKGLLLAVEGLTDKEWKQISLEMKSSEHAGAFELIGKLPTETLTGEVRFQDLLHSQYEGAADVTVLGRLKLDLSELIFLINKKFYCS